MKALSTILFIIGLIMVCAGMWFMKSLNYLIPSIIGVIGLMIMWIGIDCREVAEECVDMCERKS